MGFMAEVPIRLKLKLSMSRQTTLEEPLGKKLLRRRGSDYLTQGYGREPASAAGFSGFWSLYITRRTLLSTLYLLLLSIGSTSFPPSAI
jgi:hypothetical protein